jgi:hypothetical protein
MGDLEERGEELLDVSPLLSLLPPLGRLSDGGEGVGVEVAEELGRESGSYCELGDAAAGVAEEGGTVSSLTPAMPSSQSANVLSGLRR